MKNLTAKEILGNLEHWLQIDYQYILKVMQQFAAQEEKAAVEERNKEIEAWLDKQFITIPYEMSMSTQKAWKVLNDLRDFLKLIKSNTES